MKLTEYTIRLCKKEEYGKLIDFFIHYWSPKHIFCRNKKIFEFQHGTAENGTYDFVVAVHNETEEFHAVLGFISSATYDGGDVEHPKAIYGALWKVRDDVHNKEIGKIGLGVLYYLLKSFPESDYITLGLSGFSQQIYDSLHFDFGKLKHYYIASNSVEEFKICQYPAILGTTDVNAKYELKVIHEIPNNWSTSCYPRKNSEYYKNRYAYHPFYRYEFLGILKNGELALIWVTRKITVGKSCCLRIVDMIGDFDSQFNILGNIHQFMREQCIEYIDCYNHGIREEYFSAMGFAEIFGNTVIPNYFEPFERQNVDIHYASYAKHPVVVFKGDGDQDRPSILGGVQNSEEAINE